VTATRPAGPPTSADDDPPIAELPASSVTVYPDGPLVVRGNFTLREVDGETLAEGHTVALCRCGRSALKPFCDGSHKIKKVARRR
jgi:hypothetical protein